MPAWPGGPCPTCGEDMQPNLIHCFTCRTLLNSDLESDSIEIPAFQPLQEIVSMVDVSPAGYFVSCPKCRKELRISRKYRDQKVACKSCSFSFTMDLNGGAVEVKAFYTACPACAEELRASTKYLGQQAVCKHCGGQLRLVDS